MAAVTRPVVIDGTRPMRRMLFVLLAFLLAAPLAEAGVGPFEANDTGGIIAWSPSAQRQARFIAADHCARYGKRAHITSVYPRYGAYIGFACQFPRVYRHKRGFVLRARY